MAEDEQITPQHPEVKKVTGKLVRKLEGEKRTTQQMKAAEEGREMARQHFETAERMTGLNKKKPEVPPGEEIQ